MGSMTSWKPPETTATRPPARVDARDHLGHAIRHRDLSPDGLEHRLGEPGERRDALAQALLEVEFAVHRAEGDLGDSLERARVLGEQLDDLVLDQR